MSSTIRISAAGSTTPVTAANVNDISAAKEMPIEAGATYVFDLGCYDFGFFAKLDALGCRLVMRFKTNTPLNEQPDMPLAPGTTVLSDRIEPDSRGLDPAIHALGRKGRRKEGGELKKPCFGGRCNHTRRCRDSSLSRRGTDGRVKPGQDGRGARRAGSSRPTAPTP